MQNYNISYKGQNIFVGIDVHKKNWQVAALTESGFVKRLSINASAQVLFDFLQKHFPDGTYHAVYESGFSGFSTYFALNELGIDCIVTHAADVPATQYEEIMKTDRIDAEKLARALKAGLLKNVYVLERDRIDDRSVVRIRKTIQNDMSAYKSRIKHLLHNNGVAIPESYRQASRHWSYRFISWLKNDVQLLSSSRLSLDLLIHQLEILRGTLLNATKEVRKLSCSNRYKQNYDLMMSIPGIGPVVAMSLLVEIQDVARFRNERQFASYLGVIPTCHSSGEKVAHGEMTFRGNKKAGPMLIEACWIAIYKDQGLGACYSNYKKRMTGQEAIVRIARKLTNIMYSVLKNQTPYVPYQWNN